MKIHRFLPGAAALLLVSICAVRAAEAPNFGGEYADKKFLKGQAVFQLSLTQNGNEVQVGFDAVYNDGHGAAPEGDGMGKIVGQKVQFTFKDSFGNAGHGTITRTPDGVILSMNTTRVADSRCLAFYGQNMRLQRVSKK
jgi:hypothetical protein